MKKEEVKSWAIVVTVIAGITLGLSAALAGVSYLYSPATFKSSLTSFMANRGSDWLVVQYSANGNVINYWDVRNAAIMQEEHSDGIWFIDNNNEAVHLSGHYVFVQNPSEETKKALTKGAIK